MGHTQQVQVHDKIVLLFLYRHFTVVLWLTMYMDRCSKERRHIIHTKNVFKILSQAIRCPEKLSTTVFFWLFLLQLVKVSNNGINVLMCKLYSHAYNVHEGQAY